MILDEALPLPPAKPKEKSTILVVDDQFMARWLVSEFLREHGYKVVEAVDATEAMGLAGSGMSIDAVFTDVQLGSGPNGHEVARWFAKHRPTIPVLLTSGADDGKTTPRGKLRQFVPKPYDLAQVEQLLRAMLEPE